MPRNESVWLALAAASLSTAALVGCSPNTPTTPSGTPANAARTDSESAQVVRVVDGDTFIARTEAHPRLRVRVLGIDTPETKRPHTPVQCGGPEASQTAHGLLDHQTVTLTRDPSQDNQDRYHRLVRSVTLADGRSYAQLLLERGLARTYIYHHKPSRNAPALARTQHQAQTRHAGIWGTLCH